MRQNLYDKTGSSSSSERSSYPLSSGIYTLVRSETTSLEVRLAWDLYLMLLYLPEERRFHYESMRKPTVQISSSVAPRYEYRIRGKIEAWRKGICGIETFVDARSNSDGVSRASSFILVGCTRRREMDAIYASST